MSKKRKVTLILAAMIIALGGGAQFYTNQQVDLVLQKFPYSLDNQLSLNVTESAKNFFSRELTFSLENNDGQKTNIISTKLTALPFFITAESKLSEQLVRQLNKDLNITIDKNTINSKFSPVGDYLQSNILTDFRDFTNKTQTLSVTLDFNAGTKNVALNANLSGFNYDKNSKLEQIHAQIKLVPVGENQYDISTLELNAKNAEWDLLNGENTKIQLKNARYQFGVKKSADTDLRDLSTQLSSDTLRIANKERTTEESQTVINGMMLNVHHKGVTSAVDFANEFKKQLNGEQNIKHVANFLAAVLTQNHTFNGTLSVKSVDAPKNQKPYFNLNEAKLNLTMANADLTKANLALQLNVAGIKQTPEDQSKQWEAKGAQIVYQLDGYNLENKLAFIPLYLDALSIKNTPKEDNKTLLKLKKQWANTMAGNSNAEISLQAFNYQNVSLETLALKHQGSEENNQYRGNSTLSLKKLALSEAQAQMEDLAFNLPLTVNNVAQFAENQFCFGLTASLCSAYFTPETTQKLLENQWKALDLASDNTTLTFNLNTYPTTKAYPVSIHLKGTLKTTKDKQSIADMFIENMQSTTNIVLSKGLAETSDEESLKIKRASPFWQALLTELKPEERLFPIFIEEGDNYVLTLERDNNRFLINGKTVEELLKQHELMMDSSQSESND